MSSTAAGSAADSLVVWWPEHPEESAADLTQRCYRLIAAVLR